MTIVQSNHHPRTTHCSVIMWFRQGSQSVDTDRIRASIKSRMRRFRSPDKTTTTTSIPSVDQPDNAGLLQRPTSAPQLRKAAVISEADIDDENEIDERRNAAAPLSVQRSPSGKKLYKPENKEKSLLTDRKFKNKRIVKSGSKSKLVDSVAADAKVRTGGTLRKTSAPQVLHTDKMSMAAVEVVSAVPDIIKKHVRSHSNLNLNALLRYKLTNRKLSTADFERLRRKSVTSETASGSGAVFVDAKQSDQPLTTTLGQSTTDLTSARNSQTDDDDEEQFLSASEDCSSTEVVVQKKSPSLGARMAARFADSSANKAKKKKLKKLQKESEEAAPPAVEIVEKRHRKSASLGSELFKQNSFGTLLKSII